MGFAAVEPAAVGILDSFKRLRCLIIRTNEVGKSNIAPTIFDNTRIMKRKGANWDGSPSESRILKLDQRCNRLLIDQVLLRLQRVLLKWSYVDEK